MNKKSINFEFLRERHSILANLGAYAESYVYISTPYFIPGEAILTALKTSALSGVDVRLMIPYNSDSRWLRCFCKHVIRYEL